MNQALSRLQPNSFFQESPHSLHQNAGYKILYKDVANMPSVTRADLCNVMFIMQPVV